MKQERPLRFDHNSISIGVKGVFRVMESLSMCPFALNDSQPDYACLQVQQSKWLRASRSGIFIIQTQLGAMVEKKQVVGIITDAFGDRTTAIKSNTTGIVIGHVQNPLVSQGDALIHIGIC